MTDINKTVKIIKNRAHITQNNYIKMSNKIHKLAEYYRKTNNFELMQKLNSINIHLSNIIDECQRIKQF